MSFIYEVINDKEVEIISYNGNEEFLIIPSFAFLENKVYKVVSIAKFALNNKFIKKLFIPESIKNIHKLCFLGFKNIILEEIIVDSNNKYYCSKDGVLYTKDESIIIKYPPLKEGHTFSISKKVQIISSSCFENSLLKELTLPSKVKIIEDYAFSYCENLKFIKLSKNLEEIHDFAFYNCYSLANIKLPSKVHTLKEGVFTFVDKSITNIEISKNNKHFSIFKGGLYNKERTILYKYFSSDEIVKLSSSLEIIKPYAFAYSFLNTVILPSTLKSIEHHEFYSSTIVNIEIPSLIDVINISTFENCKYLNNVILPTNLKEINSFAFLSCKKLENLLLPNTINKLGTSFISSTKIRKINIPENILSIADDAFKGSLVKYNY